jgi:hypothetical protein
MDEIFIYYFIGTHVALKPSHRKKLLKGQNKFLCDIRISKWFVSSSSKQSVAEA